MLDRKGYHERVKSRGTDRAFGSRPVGEEVKTIITPSVSFLQYCLPMPLLL